jgi:tetratricopeptide (TPR) repeat protein
MDKTTPSNPHRSEVFISATSGDLRSVREMAKQALLTMGSFPVEQSNFPPDYREVGEMLEALIGRCDAVIHIVGVRYGEEPDPALLPQGESRRSYTQMEAEIARKLGKKVYTFLCPEDFPYDEEPDTESEEKRALQQEYRRRVANDQTIHTQVHNRDDIALKVRELQFELEKIKGRLDEHRTKTLILLAVVILFLGVLSGGIWWWAAYGPKKIAQEITLGVRFDRQKMGERFIKGITEQAEAQIKPLNPIDDWKEINEIEKERDQQIADTDRLIGEIGKFTGKGNATEVYQTAIELLQTKGVGEALEFLEAKSGQRASLIEAQKNRLDREEAGLRNLLREEMLTASLLEKRLQFPEAEKKYRAIVADAGAWAEPRNNLAWFLIQRGSVIDPSRGNEMLREAANLCKATLRLNPEEQGPQDWAATQQKLGQSLQQLGARSGGEAGHKLLEEAVVAYQHALEVRTKGDLPKDWAATQQNLGNTLTMQGMRSGGEEGRKLLKEGEDAYRHALEVYTKGDYPQDWAMAQNNLSISLTWQGKRSGGEAGRKLLEDAQEASHHALEVYTQSDCPQDWAMCQQNLGNTLIGLGRSSGGEVGRKHLKEAEAAYRSALEVYTKADLPENWATTQRNLAKTQHNLGDMLCDLGTNSGGEAGRKLFEEAMTAYRQAVEVDCGGNWRSNVYGKLCWVATLAGKIPEALFAGENAVFLLTDDTLSAARMNLAHAYLFNGQFDKAKAIYSKYRGQASEDGRKWNDEVLNDFKTLRAAGKDHPDMKKIETLLKETR